MENKSCLISKLKIALVILNLYCVYASKDGVTFSTDRHALEAIRAQITVDHSGLLSKTWTANTSICTWTGVSCGFQVQTQRVIGLDLSDMGLVGRISPDIGSLSFLTSLDLSNNSFHGSIPEEIGNLSSLQDLMLNNNELTGPVPRTLFNQSSIRLIELSFNSLSGTLPDNVCDQFFKLRLSVIAITGNKLTGLIPSSIYKCQQLQYLNMATNKFNSSIPREIGNLTLLKQLFLSENDLHGMIF
ncbi:hypothetical protein L1987_06133 [Smallanthus sonchifolius]|uniref:Uncharacterized protein n=1 Tax=Smallanthus sonchifolius TaxID=185202 RepID=A0ACB9JXF2_9ASTR|nr:hypothetical protein L1987_06133 [Smallanthus sonchifolius]